MEEKEEEKEEEKANDEMEEDGDEVGGGAQNKKLPLVGPQTPRCAQLPDIRLQASVYKMKLNQISVLILEHSVRFVSHLIRLLCLNCFSETN